MAYAAIVSGSCLPDSPHFNLFAGTTSDRDGRFRLAFQFVPQHEFLVELIELVSELFGFLKFEFELGQRLHA